VQLYSSAFSPYAARCRIQIHHKQLPVEIVPPPGGMGSAEVKAKNPIGKIPILSMDDGALAESWAIMSYLETRFPEPAMRPADALQWAQLCALTRFTDIYLAPAMFPMFRALRGAAGADAVAEAQAALQAQLQILEQLLTRKASVAKLPLDLADAALLPVIWYARLLALHFGKTDCLAALPVTQAWWQQHRAVAAAAKVLDEMETGLRTAMPTLFAAA
jgi:glutathione S-transferase